VTILSDRNVIARDVRSPKYRLRVALDRKRIANKRVGCGASAFLKLT
jgi:hypothetical protein